MRYVLLLITIIFVTSCNWLYLHQESIDLRVKNNSNIAITYFFPSRSGYSAPDYPYKMYPDTSITFAWWFLRGPIEPSASNGFRDDIVADVYQYYKLDTLSLFVIDALYYGAEILKEDEDGHKFYENPLWNQAIETYDVLIRYDLSLEDMNRFRNKEGVVTLCYPPTPEMKDIKMWPPYEEAIKNAESLKQ